MDLLIFNEPQFFLPQTTQFDKSINLFCLVLLTIEFWLAILFFTIDATFPLFLCEVKSDNFNHNHSIFF